MGIPGQHPRFFKPSADTLLEEEKQEIRVLLDRLSRNLPGFVSRPGQKAMIAEVARTFSRCREDGSPLTEGENLSVIQGPTGTGKTMAYLLAGIVLARSRKKTLLVSTATVSLQEQLVMKDLPLLASVLDDAPVFELAKGRGRYVCERNLHYLTDRQPGGSAFWKHPPSRSDTELLDRLREDFPAAWDGDRDHLSVPVPDALWPLIQNHAASCTGKRCSLYSRCPFFLRKEAASRADIVVANHDLVLSDQVLGGGVLLPPPEKSLIVFDEAHHLPGKSLSHFRESVDLEGHLPWVERVPALLERTNAFFDGRERDKSCQVEAESLAHSLTTLGSWMEMHWEGNPTGRFPETEPEGTGAIFRSGRDQGLWRFPGGKPPEAMTEPSRTGAHAARTLVEKLQLARDKLAEATTGSDVRRTRERDTLFLDIGVHLEKVADASRLLGLYEKGDPEGDPPVARWATMWKENGTFIHRLEASPVWPAALLGDVLWKRVAASCLTSATLMSMGSFASFSSRCGLSSLPNVSFLPLDSPFPLERQGVLSLPLMRFDPTDFDGHTKEIIQSLPAVLSPKEGSLVLFSSRRQMEAVRNGLDSEWQARILVQGERSRKEILALHEQRIRSGEGSVLFGLSSFSEGLDLRGDLCTHVLIAKIPFPVPTEPVEETLSEWIRARGRDPFREIALPEAGLRLVQAAGRLIRSETDHGRVTIFDKRLLEKNYGSALLRSLPPFRLETPVLGEAPINERRT